MPKRKPGPGTFAVAQDGKAWIEDWRNSVTAYNDPGTPIQGFKEIDVPDGTFQAGPGPRRTPMERAQSLATRLVQEYKRNPGVVSETLLREVQVEFFKDTGHIPSFEEMQRVAGILLEHANNKQKIEHRDKKVGWLGTTQ